MNQYSMHTSCSFHCYCFSFSSSSSLQHFLFIPRQATLFPFQQPTNLNIIMIFAFLTNLPFLSTIYFVSSSTNPPTYAVYFLYLFMFHPTHHHFLQPLSFHLTTTNPLMPLTIFPLFSPFHSLLIRSGLH